MRPDTKARLEAAAAHERAMAATRPASVLTPEERRAAAQARFAAIKAEEERFARSEIEAILALPHEEMVQKLVELWIKCSRMEQASRFLRRE
ncbi:TPA: hypothetical protein DIC21_00265 [Candidatus Uhrbacteria bacterium]|nr:hypothetical protein [Candidatus Uhrbacteria bacterium]